MNSIPHSGNLCSGICNWQPVPCPHDDCWQCEQAWQENEAKERKAEAVKLAAKIKPMTAEEAEEILANRVAIPARQNAKVARPRLGSALAKASSQKPEEWQKTTITRAALEALVNRAGLQMDWNNGDPIVFDNDGWSKIDQVGGRTIGQDAARSFDETVRGLVRKAFADDFTATAPGPLSRAALDTIEKQREAYENRERQRLIDSGVNPADIAAAETLLRGKLQFTLERDREHTLTVEDIKTAMAKLKAVDMRRYTVPQEV